MHKCIISITEWNEDVTAMHFQLCRQTQSSMSHDMEQTKSMDSIEVFHTLSCRGINLKTRLKSNKMLYLANTILEQRHGQSQNLCCPDLTRLRCGFIAVLKIAWTDKITNEEVLRRMGTGREIVRQFKTRKLQYLGHLIRHNISQIQLIEGKIEGRSNINTTTQAPYSRPVTLTRW